MAIPTTQKTQIPISTFGGESEPDSVVAKSSLWTVFSRFGSLNLKEYQGGFSRRILLNVINFKISQALDSGLNIISDRFWLWYVTGDEVLRFAELEPFADGDPTFHHQRDLDIVISSITPSITEGKYPRLFVLRNTSPRELELVVYSDVKSGTVGYRSDLSWDNSRDKDFSVSMNERGDSFHITYTDPSSPFNVFEEEYSYPPPTLTASQVPATLTVSLSWTVVDDADQYTLQRDTDPGFATAVTVYTGSANSFSDTVPVADTYYYRVKASITGGDIESDWSATETVIVVAAVQADFEGSPLSGVDTLTVNFTDKSTGPVANWEWDFGDSNTSTDQNPSHTYTSPGTYTVSLTVSDLGGSDTDTEVKHDYIVVVASAPVANFSGDILEGYPPLIVQFTDLSSSVSPITEWFWDFGDGYTSTEQNPQHTYNRVQSYTVSLTIKNTFDVSDTETKSSYIRVLEIPVLVDFEGRPRTGEAPLQVSFTNLTEFPDDYAEPGWEWDFGDGEQSTQKNPVHTYIQDRFQTVTLAAKITLIPNVTP